MANTKLAKTEDKKEIKAAKPAVSTATAKPKKGGLTITLFSLTGKEAGELELPKDVFGSTVNKSLLAQAMRVYMNNQKGHYSNTKTRGEVAGSTRKIYRQKGTGRARHGSIMAPIFVGGGIALGPKSRKTVLELPKKMKKAALLSALSQKAIDQEILGVSGLEKATGKTKEMVSFLKKVNKKSALLLTTDNNEMALRSARNIPGVTMLNANQVNAFEVIRYQSLILTKEAVEKLQQRMSEKTVKTEPTETKEVTKPIRGGKK